MRHSKGFIRKVKKDEEKRRALPPHTLTLSLDLSKKEHSVFVSDHTNRPISRFKIPHSLEGINSLIIEAERIREGLGYSHITYFMEPTSHLWMNVANILEENGLNYRLIHPLSLWRQREIASYTYSKSDYRDAELINQLGTSLNFTSTQLPKEPIWIELEVLASEYQDVRESKCL